MTRYVRQMQLADIGLSGQARLDAAHVAIIGAGGLGCPALQYLAGAGVGRITLIDPDHVEESNLHRQPLYRMTDLGQPKVIAAKEAIKALNPHVEVIAINEALGPSTAPGLARAADVVIDSADSFAVSYILSDACLEAGTPFISASVLGQTGYIGGYCGTAPSLRALFPNPPTSGATCATTGVLGPVVGVFGALQAQLALRVILDAAPSALGQVMTANLAELSFRNFSLLGSCEPTSPAQFISKSMVHPKDVVVDLRDEEEAPAPIIENAMRLSLQDICNDIPHQKGRVVLACHSGLRAWRAAHALSDCGVINVALIAEVASA